MLGLAKRVGARFLLTSTSEVYGDPLQHPQAETYWGNVNPIGNPPPMATNPLFFPFPLLILYTSPPQPSSLQVYEAATMKESGRRRL